MLRKFKTKDDFLGAVSSEFKKEGAPEEVRSALLHGISTADDTLRTEPAVPGSVALNLRIGGWVIRDDDFPFLHALGLTATAVAASLTTGGLAWPAVVAAITSFADLCWRAWRKGARLSSVQVAVFGFLQAHGPADVERLASLLRAKGEEISTEVVEATLRSLMALELNNGDIIALAVREDGNLWRAKRI